MKKSITIQKDPKIKVQSKYLKYLMPTKVYLQISKNAQMQVKKRNVLKGDIIYVDNNESFYSPISGTIDKIIPNNKDGFYLVIKNDFKENATYKGLKEFTTIKIRTDFLNRIKECSLINYEELKNIDYLLINGIDDEPYIANKMMIHTNFAQEIMQMVDILKDAFKIKKVFFCLKETDRESIEKISDVIDIYDGIYLKIIADVYPLSYNNVFQKYLSLSGSKKILTTEEIYELYIEIIKERKKDTTFITITGDIVENPLVIETKIGTPLKEIIKENITLKSEDYTLILNGLLKGREESLEEVIIDEHIVAAYFMSKQIPKSLECIRCGKCIEVCPNNCNPYYCYLKKTKQHIKNCNECGLCTYICPSHIKLYDYIGGNNE